MIFVIWLISFLSASPWALFTKVPSISDYNLDDDWWQLNFTKVASISDHLGDKVEFTKVIVFLPPSS